MPEGCQKGARVYLFAPPYVISPLRHQLPNFFKPETDEVNAELIGNPRGGSGPPHRLGSTRVVFGRSHVLFGETAWFLARRDDTVVV